jgi:hypothetical protein
MPSDETRCAVCGWPLGDEPAQCRRGDCSFRPRPERLFDAARAAAEARRSFAPSAPSAEVECNTDYGIEGVGLPPLQCDCHKDGDPRHCSKCINHSWGKAGARPTEQREEHGFGCDPAEKTQWIVTWRSDDGEFIHEGHDAFDTHEAAERYIDSIKDEWTSYDLYRGELIRSGR